MRSCVYCIHRGCSAPSSSGDGPSSVGLTISSMYSGIPVPPGRAGGFRPLSPRRTGSGEFDTTRAPGTNRWRSVRRLGSRGPAGPALEGGQMGRFNAHADVDLSGAPRVSVDPARVDVDVTGAPTASVSPIAVDLPEVRLGNVRVNVTLPDITFQATKRLGGILAALGGGGVNLDDLIREILGTFSAHEFNDVARVQFGEMRIDVEPVDADLGEIHVHGGPVSPSAQPVAVGVDLHKVQVAARTSSIDAKVGGKVDVTGGGDYSLP